MKKSVVVDFDGVLHKYSKGWHDGTIYDGPVEGAAEAMQALLAAGYRVVVFTTRALGRTINGEWQEGQFAQIERWLVHYGIPYTEIYIGPGKPIGSLYIDDRAWRFDPQHTGQTWANEIHAILSHLDKEK